MKATPPLEAPPAPPNTKLVLAPKGLGDLWRQRAFTVTDEELGERVHTSVAQGGDRAWDDLTRQMIHASCAFFAQEVLTGPPEFPYNGKFVIGPHHSEWDDLVLDYKRLMVEAPRDHGKTFFFDFAYPLWKIVTMPGGEGFIFSNTKDQAVRILADIKQELEQNPRLRYLVPSRKSGTRWSSTTIQCTNGHRIYARGFGTKVRGAHPNYIVVDDGLNDETMYSELVRTKQIEYFYSAITNMIVPGGQIIVVGTPFHLLDLYGDLSQNPEYEFRRYAALNAKGVPLWPDRYSKETLVAKRAEIGMVRFTREFMCEPIADDMSLFPGYLFAGDPTEQFTLKLGMDKKFWDDLGVTVFMGVDFALSSSVQADYTVIFVMGLDKYGNRWIIDIVRGKGIPYQSQLSKINEIGKRYDAALIFLEANQAQRIFGDELIRMTDLPIKLFTTGVEKNALDKGVPSLRVLLENRKFRIPRGDARSIEMTSKWIEEMRNFTFHEGKLQSVGGHDDMVMAAWICDQAIRAGGFSFDFGEDVDTDQDAFDKLMEELTIDPEEVQKDGPNGNGQGMLGQASGNLLDEEDDPLRVRGVTLPMPGGVTGEWF